MSASTQRGLRLAIALFLGAILQCVYADALSLWGAQPNFLTLCAILGAMFCDINGGAAVGFAAGLLHASLAAPPFGGFGGLIMSRTLVGFGVSWLKERVLHDTPLMALLLVATGSVLAEALFALFAPPRHFSHWLRNLGGTALYNTLLALPCYLLLRRFLGISRNEYP